MSKIKRALFGLMMLLFMLILMLAAWVLRVDFSEDEEE